MVKTLLAQPLRLAAVVEGRKALGLPIPAEHGSVQLESVARLRVVLSLEMQIVQLIDVSV